MALSIETRSDVQTAAGTASLSHKTFSDRPYKTVMRAREVAQQVKELAAKPDLHLSVNLRTHMVD